MRLRSVQATLRYCLYPLYALVSCSRYSDTLAASAATCPYPFVCCPLSRPRFCMRALRVHLLSCSSLCCNECLNAPVPRFNGLILSLCLHHALRVSVCLCSTCDNYPASECRPPAPSHIFHPATLLLPLSLSLSLSYPHIPTHIQADSKASSLLRVSQFQPTYLQRVHPDISLSSLTLYSLHSDVQLVFEHVPTWYVP